MRKFFELLKSKGSFALLGLLFGLLCGFKLANAKYLNAQLAARQAAAVQAAANLGKENPSGGDIQQQTAAVLERARGNPNDFEAQLDAADQYLQIQRPQGALEFLTQANRLKPNDPRPLSALATAHLMMRNPAEAIKYARQTLKQKPDDLGGKVLLLFALIEARQNLDEAERLLNEAEQMRPGDQILTDARQALSEAKAGPARPPANESAPNAANAGGKQGSLEHGLPQTKPQ